MNKGNNGTVSETVSSADPPRRMKRKATAMWSRSSSSCDNVNDEAEGTERGLSEAEEEEVAAAAAETRAGTLTEALRMSERNVPRPNYAELDGDREDDSKSDSEKESRATKGCLVSTDKGINGTVSEAVSSAELPHRVKRKASVMWRSSSSNDDGEAEGMERCKFKKREKGRGP